MLIYFRSRFCAVWIGVLRALGASGWSVLGQFVFEGVFLCFVAGVFGLAVGGVGVSFFAGLLLPSPVVGGVGFLSLDGVVMGEVSSQVVSVGLTLDFVLFGLGIVVLLGVVGSLYPAWRASRIKPVEAMRYD